MNSADPTNSSSVALSTEITGNGYARQACTFSISGNIATNTANILFPVATPDGYTAGWVSVWDANNDSANLLVQGPLDMVIALIVGNQYEFSVGDLAINIS